MIARVRAWLRHTDELAAARAELRQVHKALGKEQLLTAGLTSDINEQARQLAAARLQAEAAEAQASRLRADKSYVTAERCECGGDAELYWRRQAETAERQARLDRANAVRLADDVERLQQVAEEAERLQRAIELGRAGIAVVS